MPERLAQRHPWPVYGEVQQQLKSLAGMWCVVDAHVFVGPEALTWAGRCDPFCAVSPRSPRPTATRGGRDRTSRCGLATQPVVSVPIVVDHHAMFYECRATAVTETMGRKLSMSKLVVRCTTTTPRVLVEAYVGGVSTCACVVYVCVCMACCISPTHTGKVDGVSQCAFRTQNAHCPMRLGAIGIPTDTVIAGHMPAAACGHRLW
eukprot:TRINITY_DN32902_c0_g1_i1.p1 TRINITY_DN32902_c0_g1~~TRINITY_DN32902_c0_g1_i1.p1  ORF type:complete len:205 (-),score=11.62 TRINITY_DN32902_c0_g1_i1:64-678(-)